MIDLDYRKLLLSAAFHAMTCDGEVDQDELDSIQSLSQRSKIFGKLDVNFELKELSKALQQSTRDSFRNFFSEVQSANLEFSEQMQVVEVVIRVVYADGKIDENEIMYLKKIISILGILPELLEQRFGSIRKLLGLAEERTFSASSQKIEFSVPEVQNLESINIKEFKQDNMSK
jgi:uncharacterized tellurite resistance protein B-like protein